MLALITTNLAPEIFLPAYGSSRISFAFFAIFMLLGFFILMNILLGMIFNNYKKRNTESMLKKN
jgi:two pore calcium channel protein